MMEKEAFYVPQRLNSLGYIINILKTIVTFIKQFIFVVLYFAIKRSEIFNSSYFWLILLGLFVLVTLIAYVNFISFKYYINEKQGEFVVQKGLMSKSKIVINLDNILQVNITQNVFQKVLSLYSLTLDTAGSSKVEVDLYALDGRTATQLKELLLSKINQPTLIEQPDTSFGGFISASENKESLLKLSTKNILLYSLFSNYRQGLALFFAFAIYLFQNIRDVIDTFEIRDDELDNLAFQDYFNSSIVQVLILLGLIVIAIPFLINLVRYFFKYFDLHIRKNELGTFSLQYGLLQKVNTIFNQDKIQLLIFKQNQLLKRLGLGILSLKQLVVNPAEEDQSSIDIPGIAIGDRDMVYRLALGKELFADHHILKPKMGLLISRLIKMSVIFIAVVLILHQVELPETALSVNIFYPFLAIAFSAATLYNFLFFNKYTLLYNSEYLIKRYGVWNEKEIIIPMKRLQEVEVSQTFLQRKAGSGNFYISTAAQKVSLKFFPIAEVNQLTNYMLYFVEK